MAARIAALVLVSLALLWTAVNRGGVPPGPWFISIAAIGASLALAYVRTSIDRAPKLPRWVAGCLVLLIAYIAFQFVPLPTSLLQIIDPHRAAFSHAADVATGRTWAAPIATTIPAGLLWFATLLACLAVFFCVRLLASELLPRLWLLIFPLIAMGVLEAAIGLMQVASGVDQATGTFNSRDHYGCLLELTIPVAVSCGLVFLRRAPRPGSAFSPAIGAGICWLASVEMLLAIFASLSRGATMAAIFGLCFLAAVEVTPVLRRKPARIGFLAALVTGAAVFLAVIAPSALQQRFTGALSTGSESRLDIWRESMPMLRHYFFTGTGLLSFESVFERYQRVAPHTIVNFAHNDYLEYLIELGIIGFALLMAFVTGVIRPIFQAIAFQRRQLRTWCAGCAASIAALVLHSFFDFNLYVPADLMLACWIAGFGYAVANTTAAGASEHASANRAAEVPAVRRRPMRYP